MKLKSKTYVNISICLYFVLGIVFLIYGVSSFYAGYHNMDLGQNMRWLNSEYGLALSDTMTNEKVMTAEQGYILGINQLRMGFTSGLIGMFLLGFSYSNLKQYK